MNNLLLEGGNSTSSIVMLVVLGILIVLMLVLPSISNKKRVAAYREMQDGLKAGDKVQTVGGIIGRIVRINEKDGIKTMVLETGDREHKMYIEFNLDAIAGVVTNENIAKAEATTTSLESEVLDDVNGNEPEVVDVEFDGNTNEKNEEVKPQPKNSSKKKKS